MHTHMKFREDFLRHLEMVKDSRGLSHLAGRAGIDQGNLSRIANKEQNPRLDIVSNLLEAMGGMVIFPGDSANTCPDKALQAENGELRRELYDLQKKYIALLEKRQVDN